MACLVQAAGPAAAQEQAARPSEPGVSGTAPGGFAERQRAETPAAQPHAALAAEAQDALNRINAYRAAGASCGSRSYEPAPPLAWSPRLEQAAQAHARDMARRRATSHSGGEGSTLSDRVASVGYTWAALGENVSAGYLSIPDALEGWMKSPSHCGNIMGRQFREVGLGAAHSAADAYGWYRAMVLGSPR